MKSNAKKATISFKKAPKRTYAHAYDQHGVGYWFYEEGKKGVGFGVIECKTPSGHTLPTGLYFIQKPNKR